MIRMLILAFIRPSTGRLACAAGRLFEVEIVFPPLRECREDVAPLSMALIEDGCRQFEKGSAAVSRDLVEAFERDLWPGSVRQLRREVERLIALTPAGEALSLSRCSPALIHSQTRAALAVNSDLSILSLVEELEVMLIKTAIERMRGNKVRRVKLLGIIRQGLHMKLKRYQLAGGVSEATDATPGVE